ncbi:hypothetical protein K466DRAFT_567223 [Polyporus arcularius HHB13444]|uniref:Uncharacterized protein n=1 Tax=Polyporus arcularius HHB13444 TaxID=1314778 RepID=A0A5C3P599_9APHY|nr:hypothetical protein K466DRAFT_567223 [Polyporus arcularius HHB13444]
MTDVSSPFAVAWLRGVVTQISNNLLTPPVSGLMGLGFKSISSSNAQALEPGGMVNCGAVNTSLYEYTGDIHYQHIPEATGSRTWLIPGSEALTGDNAGYYTYPCDTNVTVTMKFRNSSISWPISNANVYSVFRASPVIPITLASLKLKRMNRNGTRSDTGRVAVEVRESCGVGQAC